MYNLPIHYENIFRFLHTIIAEPRAIYLYPFGATQPENIEILRHSTFFENKILTSVTKAVYPASPLFIFYDQEPLNFIYNKPLFDYIKENFMGPFILVSTERDSEEKNKICEHYGFANLDYFFHIFAAHDWFRGSEFLDAPAPPDRELKKSYITFNRLTSNERIYRSLFVNELYKNDLLQHGHVSFSKDCPDGGNYIENLHKGVYTLNVKSQLIVEACANLETLPELRIDFKNEDIPNRSMVLSPLPELMESFIFVVTETCYWQKKTHLTEKIFKPIVLRMPFLLLGCANNLAYLRDYGFKTFGDYWDESYDSIEDPILRLEAVTKILKDISQLTPAEQKAMLIDMQPILDHNCDLFNNPALIRKEWKYLKDSITDIMKFYRLEVPYKFNPKNGQYIPLGTT